MTKQIYFEWTLIKCIIAIHFKIYLVLQNANNASKFLPFGLGITNKYWLNPVSVPFRTPYFFHITNVQLPIVIRSVSVYESLSIYFCRYFMKFIFSGKMVERIRAYRQQNRYESVYCVCDQNTAKYAFWTPSPPHMIIYHFIISSAIVRSRSVRYTEFLCMLCFKFPWFDGIVFYTKIT